jgi:hypothetical protein
MDGDSCWKVIVWKLCRSRCQADHACRMLGGGHVPRSIRMPSCTYRIGKVCNLSDVRSSYKDLGRPGYTWCIGALVCFATGYRKCRCGDCPDYASLESPAHIACICTVSLRFLCACAVRASGIPVMSRTPPSSDHRRCGRRT